MENKDKPIFGNKLFAALEISGIKNVNTDVLTFWWEIFEPYTLEAFCNALRSAIEESSGRLDPAKVKKYLPCPLGHPTTEEAWNAAPKSENETAYITDEIMAAISAADDSIIRGDMIGARMCFKEVYEKSVSASKILNKRARFWMTEGIGNSEQVREENRKKALSLAHAKGWISDSVYQNKLKSIDNHGGNVARLEDYSKGLSDRKLSASKNIEIIKKILRGDDG